MIPVYPIARIRTEFPTKFGVPRQSGLIDTLQASVVFEPEYRNPEALRGLEQFSHLWLLWHFSLNAEPGTPTAPAHWSPTVRPPRLGGNVRMGVFATRSPFRPNPIGLSSVKLDRIEWQGTNAPILHVLGADLVDNTPILDIKPYIPYTDSHPKAATGFAVSFTKPLLQVKFPPHLLEQIPGTSRDSLIAILEQDPRPAYQDDPTRLYGMYFSSYHIHFTVSDGRVYVQSVTDLP